MDLENAARTAVNQCVELGSDESVVVVTDRKREDIANSIYDVASEVSNDVSKVVYPVGEQHGEEPPEFVSVSLRSSDVFFAPTTKSITHTRAVGNAVDNGSRGATLPGITKEAFSIGLNADYRGIRQNCEELYENLKNADEVRFETDKGTELTFKPRNWNLDTGDITEQGTYANLPSGEVFTAPEEVSGTIVYDGSIRPHGLLSDDIVVEVEDGTVTSISDEGLRSLVESAAEEAGQNAYNLAEVAIGANPAVSEPTGNILLDEKAAGTVHIAIGDNINFGGNVSAPIHEDGVVRNPRVYVDGEEISIPKPEI